MNRIYILLIFSAVSIAVHGQTAEEAIRYSQLTFGGTARGLGVGGAMSAIGADLSSLHVNPAGIGQYRSSEFSFSGQLMHSVNRSKYLQTNSEEEVFNLNMPNIGMVYNISYEDSRGNRGRGKWISTNLGLTYTRLANFNNRREYVARNTFNSTLSEYAADLNAAGPTQDQIVYNNFAFETVMAYETYLVNPLDSVSTTYTAVTDGGLVDQQISIDTEGGIDELGITVGSNYNHKLYFAFYLGIPILRYDETIVTREDDVLDTITDFEFFKLEQTLNTTGVGINAKLGLIYRPNRWMRVGAAIHSPTRYSMNDLYDSYMSSNFNIEFSPLGEFDYKLSTPWRFVGSLGIILKKYGFISADYEYVNYSKAKYDFKDEFSFAEQAVNAPIGQLYGKAHIVRVGAEAAIQRFRVRAGYAYYGSPFENPDDFEGGDNTRISYTAGFGFREKRWYVDIAYVRTSYETLGPAVNAAVATNDITQTAVTLTGGFRF